jgi:inosine/xanthosine triphosphatase
MAQKIIVGSTNPVKIRAVEVGFTQLFGDLSFELSSVNAASEVSEQPMGSEETLTGATNRALNAQRLTPDADFWVGIEGGNIRHGAQDMEVMAWVVVVSKTHRSKARTAGFFLPPPLIALIEQGYELGKADDIVFGTQNSKQNLGSVGLLTDGAIDRLQLYVPAVVFAFLPFFKTALYGL